METEDERAPSGTSHRNEDGSLTEKQKSALAKLQAIDPEKRTRKQERQLQFLSAPPTRLGPKRNAQPSESTTTKRSRVPSGSPPAAPSPTSVSLPPPRRPLPPHRLVLAPMVGGSELAYRLLARRHGAELCYTPMIKTDEWLKPGGGVALLERERAGADCPLVAHFGGNDPEELLACAECAQHCEGVAAVDLNLGCPQRSAQSGHFGAFLCATPADRELVLTIVRTLAHGLIVPVFCKVRLCEIASDGF